MQGEKYRMALDDPVVWILIIAVIVFLFGSSKIPGFARALGQARREFDNAWKGITPPPSTGATAPASNNPSGPNFGSVGSTQASVARTQPSSSDSSDPLFVAAQKEGIDTQGKTRQEVASELAWKLRGSGDQK